MRTLYYESPWSICLPMHPRRISGYGSIFGPIHCYERLPVAVCTAVDAVGFGPFCSGLIQMRAESWLYGALVERWWETTDSFHLSSTREMMLTPYDFSMLTELRVGAGGPVIFDPDMTQWKDAQRQLLGAIPDATSHEMVPKASSQSAFLTFSPLLQRRLLSTPATFSSLGVYLFHFPGPSPSEADRVVSTPLPIDWHPWAGIPQVLRTTYTAAWHASTIRILFQGPFGQAYYMGERFIRQTRGVADPDVPFPPPPIMRVVDELQDGPQINLLMSGEDGDRHHMPGDFTALLHSRVIAPLTPGIARDVPKIAAAAAIGVDVPAGGVSAVGPLPGFPTIPTAITFIYPRQLVMSSLRRLTGYSSCLSQHCLWDLLQLVGRDEAEGGATEELIREEAKLSVHEARSLAHDGELDILGLVHQFSTIGDKSDLLWHSHQ
ncbi:hypothetical protein ACSBR1_043608 [Camellia fascicularis]